MKERNARESVGSVRRESDEPVQSSVVLFFPSKKLLFYQNIEYIEYYRIAGEKVYYYLLVVIYRKRDNGT